MTKASPWQTVYPYDKDDTLLAVPIPTTQYDKIQIGCGPAACEVVVDELLDMGLRGSIMAVQRPVNVPAGTRFACRYIDD